jgi:pimeloyl-ACP methyl ester carboxylesterase
MPPPPPPPPPRRRRRPLRILGTLLALVVLAVIAAGAAMVRPDLPLDELATYAAPPSRFVNVDGIDVHVRDEGQGPPLVLLHGTGASLHTWDGWARALAPRRRIVRLDLPGFGLTGPAPDGDYRPERYVRLVVALLDKLGIERADVAGNSLGGRVALLLALDHPARVRKLVLIDAAGYSDPPPPALFRMARNPVGKVLLRWLTPEFLVRRNLREVYGDPDRVDEATVHRYQDLARRAGNRDALIDRLNGPPSPVLASRLGELKLPVLIQWGAKDRWIPLANGEGFQRGIAGSQLAIYPDAGHVPMEEIPEVTARDADAFLGAE